MMLLECPFCGGEGSVSQGFKEYAPEAWFYIKCIDCAVSTDVFSSKEKEDAISAWNKRV
jgi:Lar family restriction alleviation protein